MIRLRLVAVVSLLLISSVSAAFAQAEDDHTLTSAELVERGMPSPDHVWKSDDFDRATSVLAGIDDHTLWPRSGSKRSGAMFARLVSSENFAPIGDANVPMGTRLATFTSILRAYSSTLNGYVSLFADGKPGYDVELVDLMTALLSVSVPGTRVAQQFIAGLDRADPSYEARHDGYQKMCNGVGALVAGAVTSIGERDGYRTAERLRLARNVAMALPDLIDVLPQSSQRDVSIQLEEIAANETDAAVKTVLHDLQRQLAAKKPAQ